MISIDWSLLSSFNFNAETHWKKNLSSFRRDQQTPRGFFPKLSKNSTLKFLPKCQTYCNFHILLCICVHFCYVLIILVFFVNFKSKCRLKKWKKIWFELFVLQFDTYFCAKKHFDSRVRFAASLDRPREFCTFLVS